MIQMTDTHQLIFTSCRRGIAGVNDGQQIYSYDAGFPVGKLNLLQPLFSYRTPNLPSGVLMTEDLVPAFPKSFSYKKLDPNLYDIFLNTYLGKDYMGPTGRYGNFLSHHILYEELPLYPAELYGSGSFRTSMNFEEVNRNEPPAPLRKPQATRGDSINFKDVSLFLQSGNRIQTFNKMAACLLESTKVGKRILINDSTNNIINWIAALHYMLPIQCAENVSFSTYLYNPMESDWRIVGVVEEGTLYQASSSAYVFDTSKGIEPDVKTDTAFARFVEVGFTISEETLVGFHEFLNNEYPSYTEVDDGLYGALAVYQLNAGFLEVTSLIQALDFLSIYGARSQRAAFINRAFTQKEVTSLFEDQTTRDRIIGFFNSIAQSADELLELTLDAEGYLLDLNNGLKTATLLWENFNQQMIDKYRDQSPAAYRGLLEYRRDNQAIELFTLLLKDKENGNPTEQFNGIVQLLESPDQLPPFIDVYYQYAIEPKQREHLLRFIMENDVAFTEAATLVREALEPYRYGKVTSQDARNIRDIWEWVIGCRVDVNNCGKLWGLVTGIYINAIKQEKELEKLSQRIAKTRNAQGIDYAPSDVEYLNWVLPKMIAFSDSAQVLRESISAIAFTVNDEFINMVCNYPMKQYRESTWLKVAEYLFGLEQHWVLDIFAQASRKLSDRNLVELDKTIKRTYRTDTDFIKSWEYLYQVIQGKGLRRLRGLFKKKDDDSTRNTRRGR